MRLRSSIGAMPKAMAPINGKPFLHYIFAYLKKQGVGDVVLSVGYKKEVLQRYFGNAYESVRIKYSVEEKPLGTGGAIRKACDEAEDGVFVLNGDTLFDIELHELKKMYHASGSDIILALKQLTNENRYGGVLVGIDNRIIEFTEKDSATKGIINGGIYYFSKKLFERIKTKKKFSFEKDVLEKYVHQLKFGGKIFGGYFIDIGTPETYWKAQSDFRHM